MKMYVWTSKNLSWTIKMDDHVQKTSQINHILTDFISPCLLVLSLFWNLRKFTFQLPPFPFFLLDLSLTMVRRAHFSIFKYLCNLTMFRRELLKLIEVDVS